MDLEQQYEVLLQHFDPTGKEELDPELAEEAVIEHRPFPVLKHPLVFCPMYTREQNRWVNSYYRQQKDRLQRAMDRGDWGMAIFTHERAYRLHAYVKVAGKIGANDSGRREMYRLLRDVWVDCENIGQNLSTWRRLFKACPSGHLMMDAGDEAVFAFLPETLTIYRGVCNDGGWSWTLKKKVAELFAHRGINDSTGEIMRGRIDKADVFAYFGQRDEDEILVLDPSKAREAEYL